MLSPLRVTTSGGDQTFSASVIAARLPQMFAGILRAAHGTVTIDHSTHLPSSATLTLSAVTPRTLVKRAQGIGGIHLQISVTFDHWNAPVHVTAPAVSTPLRLSQLALPGGLTQ
jgi:hypothetical protein